MTNKPIIQRRDVADADVSLLCISVTKSDTKLGNLHPTLARIYAARNVKDAAQLEHSLKRLHPFHDLKGIEKAVDLLVQALQNDKSILVIGDFDADGATSTALAIRVLRMLGATRVDFLVPDRFKFGYGLTPEIVEVAAKRKPDLIITVDNGISSLQGVATAKALGINVLITDHHLPADELPVADAIVNPNQPGDIFPSKNLAGVGVIFYVMLALRAKLRDIGWFEKNKMPEPNLAQVLDLVALGTVADVVPLDDNNRILVAQGLARIRAGHGCAGIKALLNVTGRNAQRLVSADFGFSVAPRINAAGRLEDMSVGIECLLTDDATHASELARQLDKLNRERRNIEEDMRQQAMSLVDNMELAEDENSLPIGLCLFDESWHEGVIGILASRIKDRVHRPVIAFAQSGDGLVKGSARSVPGLHIRDVLDAIAARHPELLKKFGGHAMAAGLTLQRKDYEHFTQAFDEEVSQHLSQEDLQGIILSDGELPADELNIDFAELLRNAGPWGQGFTEPIFDGEFEILNRRIVGEKHLKLVLKRAESASPIDAIAFNITDKQWPPNVQKTQVAYRLDVNEYQGVRSAQLIIQHIMPV